VSIVLHLSDTHFGTEQPGVVEALLQLAMDQAPDLLVLSGDVTQRARQRQFEAALGFLKRMPVPNILVLPGNHDIPLFNLLERLVSPYRNYQRSFGTDLEPEFESRDLLVIGVNTTRPSRHTVGAITLDQVERVSRRLRTAGAAQLRIVATHQPVRVIRDSDEKNLLRGHEAAVHAWSEAGADIILAGHIHLPHVRPLQEVFTDLPRRVWSVLAGTAVSSRVRKDVLNSVNLIHYLEREGERQCIVERWDHDGRDAFVLAANHTLHLQRP